MIGKTTTDNNAKFKKHYMTTTELARFCGVSRFTIINWIKQGKIKANRTVGKHYRITASEAISFLRTLGSERSHKKQKPATSTTLGRCWENLQKTNCDRECGNCLIYAKKINYCFLAVRKFGKEVVRCKANCFSCSYFEEIFGPDNRTQTEDSSDDKSEESTGKMKKKLLYNFVYGAGRSVQGLKGKVSDLREKISGKSLEINSQVEVGDV